MKKSLRILISDASNTVSRGMVRSIKLSEKYRDSYLIGTDVCNNYYGLYEGLFNRIYKIPKYSDTSFKEKFIEIVKKEKIDVVLLTNELEVQFWSKSIEKPDHLLQLPQNFTEICISKKRLFKALDNTEFIPWFTIIDFNKEALDLDFNYPVWIRYITEGSGGGKGSFLIKSKKHFTAWYKLIEPHCEIMVSEYLPGRNLASILIMENNILRNAGSYERIDYLLKHSSPSGVTGQISKGRLISEPSLTNFAFNAVRKLLDKHNEKLSGLITVDIKEDKNGHPKVTEINLRPVSPVFAFAQAGFNIIEYYIDSIIGEPNSSLCIEQSYPKDNLILREVDGIAIWVKNHKELLVGDFI